MIMQFSLRLLLAEQIQQSDDTWLNIVFFVPVLLNQLNYVIWVNSAAQNYLAS